MPTQTLFTTIGNPADAATGAGQYARIVRILRNMNSLKLCDHTNVVAPVRTEAHPSPMKQSASNRHPGQSHTRTTVDDAINHELAKARYLMDDLADHVFGHIVSTQLARDILRQFVDDGFVKVFERTSSRHNCDDKVALDPRCEEVECALQQAFEDAGERDCIRPDIEGNDTGLESSTKGTTRKRKGKHPTKTYSFKWATFLRDPLQEDELVSFLNETTDRAFAFAQPKLAVAEPKLLHRFAAPQDKGHAMALSYEQDGEDMRPDFVLVPREAFSDDFKTVDPEYINFTASRLVGEAKNKDLAASLEQVQRYVRGMKRAQPWVHYVLAMTITRDKVAFMRGEGSGTERLELILENGRGCIEFIRILLGLALANKIDLGQNPDVVIGHGRRKCGITSATDVPSTSNTQATSRTTGLNDVKTAADGSSRISSSNAFTSSSRTRSRTSSATSKSRSVNPRTRSTPVASKAYPTSHGRGISAASQELPASHRASARSRKVPSSSHGRNVSAPLSRQAITASSTSSKRVRSEIAEGNDEEPRAKRSKFVDNVTRQEKQMVFYPVCVYEHTCLGILFTSSSIRGRGTTVFCVLDTRDEMTRLALKMSWQDVERVAEQDAVLERLAGDAHPNVIIPNRTFNVTRNGKLCTTLGAIRGFLDEQIDHLQVENRVLRVSLSVLKRPVKYFWGVHDFMRGLRGALLGHEFLTKIGILHRDISENNIVLGVYPWEEGGYLIDFDMAILQDAEEPTHVSNSPVESDDELDVIFSERSLDRAKLEGEKRVKGLRTGTFPYISSNVLLGGRHTHFDDVESFLYVLLLFFFSYAGPLPKTELQRAHDDGFVQPTGSGRLSHVRTWPKKYADWADGDPQVIGKLKHWEVSNASAPSDLDESAELQECLTNNWPEALHLPIRSLLRSIFKVFRKSTKGGATLRGRTELSHTRFISILDKWLQQYRTLEGEYSNCPDFEDPRKTG